MKIKTSELEGAALDWAVAQAIGRKVDILPLDNEGGLYRVQAMDRGGRIPFWPHFKWQLGGPLIEQECIELDFTGEHWEARYHAAHHSLDTWIRVATGGTPLVAACRALVAAKLGKEVKIPRSLASNET